MGHGLALADLFVTDPQRRPTFWLTQFTVAVFAALLLILKKTPLGLRMRAVTQNRRMAAAMAALFAPERAPALLSRVSGPPGEAAREATRLVAAARRERLLAVVKRAVRMLNRKGDVQDLWGD